MMKNISLHKMKHCFIVLLLCLSSQPLFAEPASKIQASFDVIGYGMTLANVTETFTRTQNGYQIDSVTKAVGLLASIKPETVRVSSQGNITPLGLQPLSYSLTRVVDTHKNAKAIFNWGTSTLTHNDYKGINNLPLGQGTQDRLSVLYHLPLLAKMEQMEFKFSITDGNNVEESIYTFAADEQNALTPMGKLKARYLSSVPVGEGVKYEIWLATEYELFPCKIIVTDAKGDKLTQVLTKLTITP